MALSETLSIRMSSEAKLSLQSEAVAQNKPLRVYLREKLESGTDAKAQFSALYDAITDLGERQGGADQAIIVEIVLLLRMIAGPEKQKLAQATLRRIGMEAWSPEKR